jgi:hypothetical protein
MTLNHHIAESRAADLRAAAAHGRRSRSAPYGDRVAERLDRMPRYARAGLFAAVVAAAFGVNGR